MFTPINRGSDNSPDAQCKSLIPERFADHIGSLKGPSNWEAEALKARVANRKRSRNPRTAPAAHVDALATSNSASLHECQGESFISTALVKKTKRTNSSSVYGTNSNIHSLATTAAQAKTKMQPLTDMQPPVPPHPGGRFGSPTGRASNKGHTLSKAQAGTSEPANDPTKESKPSSIVDSTSTGYGLSLETHRKLDSFKYVALSAHNQTAPPSPVNNTENGAVPNDNVVASDRAHCALTQGDYTDIGPDAQPSARDCDHGSTYAQASESAAKGLPVGEFHWCSDIDDGPLDQLGFTSEDDFEWDRNMDDVILDQLHQIEANAGYKPQEIIHVADDNPAGISLGPEYRCRSPCQAIGDGNARDCFEVDMNGGVNDEDLFALLTNHHGLGYSTTERENAKTSREPSSTVHYRVQSPAASVHPSPAETPNSEGFPFGLGDIEMHDVVRFPGAAERFSSFSSSQYPFDDSSELPEANDSNLRGSHPHTKRTPNPGIITFTNEIQCETLTSPANILFNGDISEVIDQTGRDADRAPVVTDDKLNTTAENHTRGQDTEPTQGFTSPLSTNTNNDSTKKRKPGFQILKPQAIIGLRSTVKSKPMPHLLEHDATGNPRPFVRSPFPGRAQDRSPIVGLSSKTLLRTCFRVGEALRAGSHAGRWGQDAIIELYARVVFSSRDGWRQHFQFADLFHDRPPFLTGTYDIFHGMDLWERDSGRFLTEDGKNRMCRCIGRMKRAGANWKLVILNVWEATWDDVSWAKGIVCA